MKKQDVVQTWVDAVAFSHSNSDGTTDFYKRAIENFAAFIGVSAQQIVEDYDRCNSDREFRKKYAALLRGYISWLGRNGYAHGTIYVMVGAVRSFFKYNDLPLGYVPLGRRRVTYHNRDITKEEIASVLKISDVRDAAFFCVMAQTGLRPATLCDLKIKHIQPDFNAGRIPCRVEVPQELAKGKYSSYFTFMGEDSVRYLKAYFNTRLNLKPGHYAFTSHGRDNKRVNPKSISGIFRETVEQLKQKGLINFEQKKPGKPRTIHLYNLRKFFRKQAGHAGTDYVNFWMGHSLGVDEHYFSHDLELHRKQYEAKAMPFLRIEQATPSETEEIIAKQAEEIERLKDQLSELADLKETVKNLIKRVEAAEKQQN